MSGKSFREAYKIVGKQVENGDFSPKKAKDHSHEGSIHNPSFEKIREKMNRFVFKD